MISLFIIATHPDNNYFRIILHFDKIKRKQFYVNCLLDKPSFEVKSEKDIVGKDLFLTRFLKRQRRI